MIGFWFGSTNGRFKSEKLSTTVESVRRCIGMSSHDEHGSLRSVRSEVPEQQEVPVGASEGWLLTFERSLAQAEDRIRELEVRYQDLRLSLQETKPYAAKGDR